MSKAGRKPKITAELIERICGHIANGAFFRNAIALSGVGPSTAYYWLERGRSEPDTLYSDFLEAKTRADALFEQRHIAGINSDGNLSWQASAWMLERKYPERWGRKRLEITGADGGSVKVETSAKIVVYSPENGSEVRPLSELLDA